MTLKERVTGGCASRTDQSVTKAKGRCQLSTGVDGCDALLTVEQRAAWSTFGPEWDETKKAWIDYGLRWPPKGSRDASRSQRAILWPVLDARPRDLAKWIREAPAGLGSYGLVAHVAAKWKALRNEYSEPDESIPVDAIGARYKDAEALAAILERIAARRASE